MGEKIIAKTDTPGSWFQLVWIWRQTGRVSQIVKLGAVVTENDLERHIILSDAKLKKLIRNRHIRHGLFNVYLDELHGCNDQGQEQSVEYYDADEA